MSPWGYSSTTPKHAAIHEAMLKQIKENLFKEQNIVYEVGQSATVLCKHFSHIRVWELESFHPHFAHIIFVMNFR